MKFNWQKQNGLEYSKNDKSSTLPSKKKIDLTSFTLDQFHGNAQFRDIVRYRVCITINGIIHSPKKAQTIKSVDYINLPWQ